MKKIIALALAVTAIFAFASCSLLGGGETSTAKYGLVTDGGKTYFVADGGAIVIENGAAKATTAPENTAYESKKFTAPDTTEDYFTYEEVNGKINITGLTADGKAASTVIIPKTIDGKQIATVSSLDGAKNVIFADLGYAITINNGAFKGVSNVFIADVADDLGVGKDLLKDTAGVNIFVSADEISNFKSHYNWSAFADQLTKF